LGCRREAQRVFDQEFFATGLLDAMSRYMAGRQEQRWERAQVRLESHDGVEFIVRRVLAAEPGWASVEVVDDAEGPEAVAVLFIAYEQVRRVMFDPEAAPEPHLGFQAHQPAALGAPPAVPDRDATTPTSGRQPEVITDPPGRT
jgi:hypothetical protein